jgi:myosin heavy subunit
MSAMAVGALSMADRMDRLEYLAATMQKDMHAMRKELADVRQEHADMREELADMREELADVREELADVREELADVREELADVREHQRKELADVQEQNEKLRREFADENKAQRRALSEVRVQLDDTMESLRNLQEEMRVVSNHFVYGFYREQLIASIGRDLGHDMAKMNDVMLQNFHPDRFEREYELLRFFKDAAIGMKDPRNREAFKGFMTRVKNSLNEAGKHACVSVLVDVCTKEYELDLKLQKTSRSKA